MAGDDDHARPTRPARVTAPTQPAADLPPSPARRDDYVGTVLSGRYRVLEKIGEGGFGAVYRAEHVMIEKKVAVKVLAGELMRHRELVQRFQQEAKAASKIGQENIIDITDFGETPSGVAYFVMEHLEGRDLGRVLKAGPLQTARVVRIACQVCRALGAAHAKGIFHRDLKPDNIFLVDRPGRSDFVKVLDFGLAKISALDGAKLTRSGTVFGTAEYMSPEQARGEATDHRTDIYALGCILYEMLTGDVPFRAPSFMAVLRRQIEDKPEPLSRRIPGIDARLEALVGKALAKERAARFQTMEEIALELCAATGTEATSAWGSEPVGAPRVVPAPARPDSAWQPLVSPSPSPPDAPSLRESPSTAKRTRRLRAGWGLAVVLALAAGGVWWMGLRQTQKPKSAPKIAVTSAAPPIAPAPPVAAPAPPAASRVSIVSTPDGADVMRESERLGRTPLELQLPRETEPFEVAVAKKGFVAQKLRVAPDRDRDYVLTLAPVPHAAKPRPAAATPPPAPAPSEPTPKTPRELKTVE